MFDIYILGEELAGLKCEKNGLPTDPDELGSWFEPMDKADIITFTLPKDWEGRFFNLKFVIRNGLYMVHKNNPRKVCITLQHLLVSLYDCDSLDVCPYLSFDLFERCLLHMRLPEERRKLARTERNLERRGWVKPTSNP